MPKAPRLPKLYPIVDVEVAERAGWAPRELALAYLAGGATWLQLRAKAVDGAAFLSLAEDLVDSAREVGAHVIINDRADIARLTAAAGVHVGQEDLAPDDVRQVCGASMIVGLSTHTEAQIEAALSEPISYLAIGPVFRTSTKATGYEQVGYAAVRHAAARAATVGLPVVAIGGITLETAADVIAAGAQAVAIVTDLVTNDPAARVRQYLAALGPGTLEL